MSSVPLPSPPSESERLIGTENRSDIIPNFPPRGNNPMKMWQEASLLPQSHLGVILDHSSQTAWIACWRHNLPPLLITPLPLLGKLPEEPLEPAITPPRG